MNTEFYCPLSRRFERLNQVFEETFGTFPILR